MSPGLGRAIAFPPKIILFGGFPMFLPLIAAGLMATSSAAAPAPQALHQYGGVALDPAGRRIVSVDTVQGGAGVADGPVVVVRDTQGRVVNRIDPCDCRYSGPVWSPDGSTLAFLATDGDGPALYAAQGDQARLIARISGLAWTPRWSPDGNRLALLVTENPTKATGATQAGARQVGEIAGLSQDSQRIVVVSVSGGDLHRVSPDGAFVYEYDWTPDGQGFVATAAEGNGDNNWWVAKLRTYDLEGGERVLLAPSYQMNFPRVSPDGRTVAFIGGVMSDFGSVGGDVYTVPIDGGTPVNVTPGYVGSVTSIAWRGDRLIAGIIVAGDTGTATIDPAARRVSNVRVAPQSINAGDGAVALDARGRTAAYVSQTFERAPRIEFGHLGAGRAVTHDNDALIPVTTARDVRWTNEGYAVQGWLLAPRDAAVGARRPMIVSIHGGPAAAVTPRFVWSGTIRDLLEAGYYVFQPNPRGSYGQGAAFAQANHKDFGGGDLRDILAGVDAVEQVAPIDDERLGVYGHSYGGFMTMWTVTHSQRFKAAVAGAGIANWSSYYGQNGIDKWMVPFFGATFYDDPEVYDRQSPIRSIKAARTPTFIYVGERDLETPAPQSIEFWHGLVAQGVPTSLVIYQDEGHSIRQPEHASDLTRRIVDWFGRYLKAPTGDGV